MINTESVIDFLGSIALLQRLPCSSVTKIAQLVTVRHYDEGEFLAREGKSGDGIYFIWDGEAELRGSIDDEHENQLKRYDYFGHGTATSLDVIALTKLTCLVLSNEHTDLLQPKSIWNADEEIENCPLVERILQLEPTQLDTFQGITLPDAPTFGKVFGGQFIGQALAAASKTVGCLKIVHSLHAYFVLVGEIDSPIMYKVHRVRDGNSFATRRVEAIQKGKMVFTLMASFHREEEGFAHQEAKMPLVPDPETLLSLEDLRELRSPDPRLPKTYRLSMDSKSKDSSETNVDGLRDKLSSVQIHKSKMVDSDQSLIEQHSRVNHSANKAASGRFVPWPIEIRFCEPNTRGKREKYAPTSRYWFRAKGRLSDDQALHRCVVAYASDLIFLQVSLNPHRGEGYSTSSVSLDHSMWFHRSIKADDWLLFVITSPSASNARGFVSGQMFTRNGELVVTLTQEGLIRKRRTHKPAPISKL